METAAAAEDSNEFSDYLRRVEDCLSGRSRINTDNIASENVNEDDKCTAIVKRVLDEEAVLEMVSTYLKLIKDCPVPEAASVTFTSCHFDEYSGLYELKAYLNYYMLSKVNELLNIYLHNCIVNLISE